MYKDTLRGDPFCLHKKAYKRFRKHGLKGMIERLDVEYDKAIVVNVNKKERYELWIEENESNILETKELKNNPLISIITPTYNTQSVYLVDMIESVLSQTYTNWELCIADDCSSNTDTIETLKEYEANHNNIKVEYRKENDIFQKLQILH